MLKIVHKRNVNKKQVFSRRKSLLNLESIKKDFLKVVAFKPDLKAR